MGPTYSHTHPPWALLICGWGEHVQGALSAPVALPDPSRLVYSAHVYGHGNHPYMRAADFPNNMPAVRARARRSRSRGVMRAWPRGAWASDGRMFVASARLAAARHRAARA